MTTDDYQKFQDRIFQQVRDLEDTAKKNELAEAFQNLLRAAEPLANAIGVKPDDLVRAMFENPALFIDALGKMVQHLK